MIFISTFDLVFRTIPGLCYQKISPSKNSSDILHYLAVCDSENFANIFIFIEYATIGWFTCEVALRFTLARKKIRFLTSGFTFIDLITIIPFYINICFKQYDHGKFSTIKMVNSFRLLMNILFLLKDIESVSNIGRMLKILSIFKFARYSNGLKMLGNIFKNSFKDIMHLMLFAVVLILLFSSFLYYSERDMDSTKFISIPASFW